MKRCCDVYCLALVLIMVVGCDKKESAPPGPQPEANTPAAKKPDAQKEAGIEHWQVPGKGDLLGFDTQGDLLVATLPLKGMVETTHIITIDTATGDGSQVDVEPLFLQRVILHYAPLLT